MAKILIIDNFYPNARLAEKLLTKNGHEIIIAHLGATGINICAIEKPQLVLVDMDLPDMDGKKVVEQLREFAHMAHTPIIAYTAWHHDNVEALLEDSGCDGVLIKPVDVHEFAREVHEYVLAGAAFTPSAGRFVTSLNGKRG